MTVCSFKFVPVEHEGKTAGYWSLPKPSQKLMKSSLSKVKMFIIDEVSMVSSLNLAYLYVAHPPLTDICYGRAHVAGFTPVINCIPAQCGAGGKCHLVW